MKEKGEKNISISRDVLTAWKEVNANVYSGFKYLVDSMLSSNFDWSTLNQAKGEDLKVDGNGGEEMNEEIKNFIQVLMLLVKDESTIEVWYEEAVNNRNVLAFCICCFIYLDNGVEQIMKGLEVENIQPQTEVITEYIKNFLRQKAEDKEKETAEPSDKELNLLTLRRWHYEHPQEYAAFLESVDKAYDGDMTFAYKGFNYLMEMLPIGGIKKITRLLLQFIPGTAWFRKRMASSESQSFHEGLSNIMNTDLDNEVTRQKILQNNPHFNSSLFWLTFDNGFLKAVDLISKTFLEESNPEIIKGLGRNVIKSLILTSFGKAGYTKEQWKNMKKVDSTKLIATTLMDLKGKRGRRSDLLLLEEMVRASHASPIIKEIGNTISDWRRYDETDSIFAYIFAALQECELLNGKYPYRIFHSAILEKFPQHIIKQGYDHAEALFHALTTEGNYNTSITASQIASGRKQVENIRLRFKIIMSPDAQQ